MSSTIISSPIFPKSKIRRKPISTYKSPSANEVDPLIIFSASGPSPRPPPAQSHITTTVEEVKGPLRKRARAGSYSLPLYHPLGELASSLPPLNPTDFGLPLPRILKETPQGSPGHYRRLLAKTNDAGEEVDIPGPTVSSIAAVAANEIKRTSPRKKRVSGGNGKRRRRDGDDGDATYPAKRTRQTRASGGDDNDFDDTQGQEGDGASEADGPVERRPERRSTRSRAKRRDSSEVGSVEEQPTRESASPTEEIIKQSVLEGISEEKEEGEIGGDAVP